MFRFVVIFFVFIPTYLFAQPANDDPKEVAYYFKDELVESINSKEWERLSTAFTDNAVVILDNSDIFHKKDEFIQFLSSSAILKKLKIKNYTIANAYVDRDIEVLSPNIFIASGTAEFVYYLARGKAIHIPVRWMATLIKQEDKWQIASYQGTINALENPIMDQMRHDFYMICFITLLLGFIIGIAWKKFMRKIK
ncbi:MAG: nuclear transport factor 2 family protein [Proteobacteria bacterium]|nr:nuclear transport factor 2 family protein [Pseudomonadota bacterium]